MHSNTFILIIPSIPGYEKIAMAAAAALAQQVRAKENLAQDLATAVSEACLNAMEHGHGFNSGKMIKITFQARPGLLVADVADKGPAFKIPSPRPTLQVDGVENVRGWGLFLMKNLMTRLEVHRSHGGNVVRLILEF